MTITPSESKILVSVVVWAPTVEAAMKKAVDLKERDGWVINGNPAPMIHDGVHGTGVGISKEIEDD